MQFMRIGILSVAMLASLAAQAYSVSGTVADKGESLSRSQP